MSDVIIGLLTILTSGVAYMHATSAYMHATSIYISSGGMGWHITSNIYQWWHINVAPIAHH
jgi:hypothetical protein